jgi:hypothetical protein
MDDATIGLRYLALGARMSLLATRLESLRSSMALRSRRATLAAFSVPPLPLLKLPTQSGILFAQRGYFLQRLFQPTFEIGDAF